MLWDQLSDATHPGKMSSPKRVVTPQMMNIVLLQSQSNIETKTIASHQFEAAYMNNWRTYATADPG